jgi:hypothetical protein
MPFAYFGAKHKTAAHYPAPAFPRIVEPFAGSAGYSLFWATDHHVTLVDSDEFVIDLWRQLQSDGLDKTLDRAEAELAAGGLISSPWVYSIGCGLYRVRPGGKAKRSTMMQTAWPGVRRRIEAAVPLIADWEIIHGDYREIDADDATWFVDAPYCDARPGKSGNRYGHKASGIDYAELGAWCQSRPDQVIVCEQAPASWLPFEPLLENRTHFVRGRPEYRTEMVWTHGPTHPEEARLRTEAKARRAMRTHPRGRKRGPYRKRGVE